MSRRRQLAALAARVARGVGALTAARRRRRDRGDHRAYLLEYHAVVPRLADEREGSVAVERLREHVRWLKRFDFELTTVRRLAAALREARDAGRPLPRDLLAVTFDDGYADNHDLALPVLANEGVPATVYLVSGFLDGEPLWFDVARRALAERPHDEREAMIRRLKRASADERRREVERLGRDLGPVLGPALGPALRQAPEAARPMGWDDARRLRDAGWELGAHTMTHPILSSLDRAEQRAEIEGSRARIDAELGDGAVETFAMPNGSRADYDEATLDILRELDFRAACTTRRGSNRPGDDPLQLRRLGVGAEPTALLEARLAGLFDESLRSSWPFRALS